MRLVRRIADNGSKSTHPISVYDCDNGKELMPICRVGRDIQRLGFTHLGTYIVEWEDTPSGEYVLFWYETRVRVCKNDSYRMLLSCKLFTAITGIRRTTHSFNLKVTKIETKRIKYKLHKVKGTACLQQ